MLFEANSVTRENQQKQKKAKAKYYVKTAVSPIIREFAREERQFLQVSPQKNQK